MVKIENMTNAELKRIAFNCDYNYGKDLRHCASLVKQLVLEYSELKRRHESGNPSLQKLDTALKNKISKKQKTIEALESKLDALNKSWILEITT